MSDINLLGDLSELKATRVNFNIALTCSGTSGHRCDRLDSLDGLTPYLTGRAFARIVSDSLSVSVSGSVSAARSIDVHCCIIPSTCSTYPQTPALVTTVPGSVTVQHSVIATSTPAPLRFPDGVANQLKPAPVWGEPPSLVTHHEVLGGTATSSTIVKISGVLEVGGIGFVQTW